MGLSRCIGRTKGGLNSKLHAVCNASGQPIAFHLTGGQMSDYKGPPVLLLCHRPRNSWRIEAMMPTSCECLSSKGITPCIPGRYSRKAPVAYDKELCKQRHKIEIMFGRLTDWRRIATRYDRCVHTFFSAICIAVIVTQTRTKRSDSLINRTGKTSKRRELSDQV